MTKYIHRTSENVLSFHLFNLKKRTIPMLDANKADALERANAPPTRKIL